MKTRSIARILAQALALPLLLLLGATVGPVLLLAHVVRGVVLRVWFAFAHRAHGRNVLFVYSESPTWKAYVEETILPRLGTRAVVLNWSERARWRPWAPRHAQAMHHWGGTRDFNPLALVFTGLWHVETIRFHRAFLDFRHGDDTALREAEARLFTLL
jgi:hypothetical protein